jgi:uncharacterized protein YndB with AHSA1/START domain
MGTSKITAEPGSLQIIVEREFDAPAAVILRAYTEPELLKQWLGPDGESTLDIPVCEMRDGGRWDWVFTDPDGSQQSFHGVVHGTPSVENGMLGTFEWLGLPGHVSFQTLTFDEHDGRTTIRTNQVFQTVEDRDGMIASGMEHGMNDGFAKLDTLLPTLAKNAR